MLWRIALLIFIWLFSGLNQTWADLPAVLLENSHPNGLTLTINVPPFNVETLQRSENTCDSLQMPSWMKTIETGYPELPTTGTLIQVPKEGRITVKIIDKQYKILPHFNPCPVSQPTLSAEGQIIATPVNLTDSPLTYPQTLLNLSKRLLWRDVPVVRLTVTPFQWHPTTKELYYFDKLQIQVQFEKPLPTPQKLRSDSAKGIYENLLEQTLINYVPIASETATLRKRVEPASTENPENPARKPQIGKALRFEINQAGMYHLTFDELVQAGLPNKFVQPQHLSLTNQGQEVAIKVISADPTIFTEGDAIEFYAEGVDTEFTGENIYWLRWQKKGQGKRIASRAGQITDAGQPVETFYDHLHLEENRKLWEQVPEAPKVDYWFWQALKSSSKNSSDSYDFPIELPSPALNYPEIVLRVHFQGSSDTPHQTQLILNGTEISDATWKGYERYTQEITIATQLFKADVENTLTIKLPANTEETDSVYLNWMEIDYWRTFNAVQDSLTLTLVENGRKQLTVNQFSKADIMVYDITDPYQIAEIENVTIEETGKTYQATFEDELTGEKTYYVTTTKQFKQPVTSALWQPSFLRSPKNGADYILITTDEFLPAVTPLTDLRKQQGLRVKTVSVEEIYDEFNDGIVDPTAIKNFLTYAYTNWQRPAPTYVFLVGDATIDYRGYSRAKKKSRVPAHLIDIEGFQYIIPPSDNWYVSVQGEDVLPEMLIGRIPSDSVETVTSIIGKIVRFETASNESQHKILLVADADETFQNLHEKIIIPHIPNLFALDKVYLHEYFAQAETKADRNQKVVEARQAIIDSINAGAMITTYYGHGNSSSWSASSGLFKPEHVTALTNEQYLTFLLTMSCINGHFTTPFKSSLAEVFISSPTSVIAGMLPSNLSYPSEDVVLSDELFSILFAQQGQALGSITTQAKIAAYERGTSKELVEIFTFFGDPATTLKPW